ncbi:glycoside hydrolase family 3 protein [Novosphingobium sp. 9U]|uniref:glycoside hydrolase family 3 protein n=1 Tax=Novosphingobium sp. 9U TaxID=2653158 RepID=UPI0012EFFA33|nr:glycoside hydrolase family 3 protein [Novosphingobium sp. 9U]VWX54569.1 putative Beta-glucosidase / Beta-xylosidase [Novosphingobium sp. 9U]
MQPKSSILALTVALLAVSPAAARDAKVPQPQIESRSAPVLMVDGLRFRDLNRNGRLDPYEDWRLPAAVRAKDLTARMTVPEKAGMMMHAVNSGYFGPGGIVLDQLAPPPPGALKPPVNVTGVPGFDRADKPSPRDLIVNRHVRYIMTSPGGSPADAARWANALQEVAEGTRLGVPIVISADPIHTTNRLPGGALPPPDRVKITSSWPDQIGLAATRDAALVRRFGEVASAELRAMGFRMVLNPMADVASEPRWNRIPGTFGEDAKLNGEYAAQFILGAQGQRLGPEGLMATVKHFPGDGPVEHGFDPHNPYGTKLVYPGKRWKLHSDAFAPSFKANVAFAMGSYGIPTWIDDVATNFSRKVMTDLLRTKMHFKGVAITDWMHAQPWGLEDQPKIERERRMVWAGIDQLGGEHETSYLIDLIKAGKLTEARIDVSVRRVLEPMFAMGLFENPYVDPEAALRIVKAPEYVALGDLAQRKSIVLLKNTASVLPLAPGRKVALEGFAATPKALAGRVTDVAAADVIVVKVNAPYRNNTTGKAFFVNTHEGTPVFAGADNAAELSMIRKAVASGKPVVVVMSMERPAVLSEFIDTVSGMIATFGSGDDAVADVLTGAFDPSGKLPFALPADPASVEGQAEDVPFDFARTAYPFGFGLSYSPRKN